jgi:hypothetical protein
MMIHGLCLSAQFLDQHSVFISAAPENSVLDFCLFQVQNMVENEYFSVYFDCIGFSETGSIQT